MSVLQGAKIHTLSACQSADTLMPSNLPLSVALTGKVASLLPTVPDSVWEAGKDTKESNKSHSIPEPGLEGDKSITVGKSSKKSPPLFEDDVDFTVHGWGEDFEDDRIVRTHSLGFFKKTAARLGFTRSPSVSV